MPPGIDLRAGDVKHKVGYWMRKLYVYETSAGPFYIVEHERVFYPMFKGETLGGYGTPEQAVDDLTRGDTFRASGVADTSKLGIPHDLAEWGKPS